MFYFFYFSTQKYPFLCVFHLQLALNCLFASCVFLYKKKTLGFFLIKNISCLLCFSSYTVPRCKLVREISQTKIYRRKKVQSYTNHPPVKSYKSRRTYSTGINNSAFTRSHLFDLDIEEMDSFVLGDV